MNYTLTPEQREQLLEAVEIGRDAAAQIALSFHESMRGYRADALADLDARTKQIDSAIALLQSLQAEPGWRTIETAPKDGSHILMHGTGTDQMMWRVRDPFPPMQVVGYWSWHDDERDEAVGDGLFRKVPCRVLEMWKPIGARFFIPTHWMPLPPPPSDGKGDKP